MEGEKKEEKKSAEPEAKASANVFYNPHDIIGVKGMINAQARELDRKVVSGCNYRVGSWN